MRIILELLRITVIYFILGAILGGFVKLVYSGLGIDVDNTTGGWIIGFAIIIFLFVLYRNKLQFSGFYKGEGMVKLPRKVSIFLISCVVIMLIIAPFFS
ncbi:hypothetical protein F7984_14650 [Pradoshia sp. D12]|nr:hypothetical protein F7984_14650 [Pradoshia sp. D12]